MALYSGKIFYGKPFQFEIVDRFGTGDAFFAGFLYGYLEQDIQYALDFGNALCALAHTIEGDVALVSVDEVIELLNKGYEASIRR
jgi:2-dehydro-3-deoxygluconokinase